MPIASVSRWRIPQDDAQRIIREAAPLLKNHGATSVTLGRIHSGENTGQTIVVVTYPNWETFGTAMKKQQEDQAYQNALQSAQRLGQLEQRNLVATEEVSLG